MLTSRNPVDGTTVGTFHIDSPEGVRDCVRSARSAAENWQSIGSRERRKHLLRWKRVMSDRRNEIFDLLRRENGKVHADALLELTLTIDHLDWAACNAARALRDKRVSPGLLMFNQAATIRYRPYGVIGVIGPWNYPIHTPMGSIGYALAAGNAVVFKPSEHTPAIGRWLADTFAEAVPEHPVFRTVFGAGETGAALCTSGVDKLAFTGSGPTGSKVMATCSATLTPVLMELGGKDALIVDSDADLDSAADGALWGAVMNGGQSCAGVERVYVVESAYDPFLAKIVEKANALRAGEDYGPVTMPGQLDIIRRHIDAAIADGGRAIVGGPDSIRPPFVDPVVLVDVPEDSAAVCEETFGPVVVVTRVPDVDKAIELTNASEYGLGAAVFGKKRASDIAERLHTGMVSINDVISYGGVPTLPFGGVRSSGFGRIHGTEGLREFVTPQAVTRKRFTVPVRIATFRRSARDLKTLGIVQRSMAALHR
ncbi:aldehyde dehydrogenase family protein [Rhodococcus sp. NPDC058521]|uniref:aldehyde dehydrogenase family protein n=1 Tax=Rhodococcus sp. NPDC058521 TaxID=3346536 RepID=UPI00365242EC